MRSVNSILSCFVAAVVILFTSGFTIYVHVCEHEQHGFNMQSPENPESHACCNHEQQDKKQTCHNSGCCQMETLVFDLIPETTVNTHFDYSDFNVTPVTLFSGKYVRNISCTKNSATAYNNSTGVPPNILYCTFLI